MIIVSSPCPTVFLEKYPLLWVNVPDTADTVNHVHCTLFHYNDVPERVEPLHCSLCLFTAHLFVYETRVCLSIYYSIFVIPLYIASLSFRLSFLLCAICSLICIYFFSSLFCIYKLSVHRFSQSLIVLLSYQLCCAFLYLLSVYVVSCTSLPLSNLFLSFSVCRCIYLLIYFGVLFTDWLIHWFINALFHS